MHQKRWSLKQGERIKNYKRSESRDGRSFHSGLERDTYEHLKLLERAGEIEDLKCQVHVLLTRAEIKSIIDFSWKNTKTGEIEYGEAKGFETEVWLLKKKLWKYYGPGKLTIFKGRVNKFISIAEVIIPK